MTLRFRIDNNWITYLLLLLSCMNFMGRGAVIFLFFCIYSIIKSSGKKFNDKIIPYFVMALGAILASLFFYDLKSILKSSIFFLSPFAAYVSCCSVSNKEEYIKRLLFWGSLGFFINLILTYYFNYFIIGHNSGSRVLYNFWTNEPIAVTIIGLISCVPIVYSFYLLFLQKRKILFLIGILYLLLPLYINMTTATRTPFVLGGIIYVFSFYELFIQSKRKTKVRLILLLSLLSVILFYKIVPYFLDSAIGERFSENGLETSRVEISFLYMDYMFEYPFGGSFAFERIGRMAHNVIQESYDIYGFVFFTALIIVLLGYVRRFFYLSRIAKNSKYIICIMSLYLGITIQVLLEPIIVGFPQILWFLFIVDGLTISLMENNLFIKKN